MYEGALAKAGRDAVRVPGPLPLLVAAMAHRRLDQPSEARPALARAAMVFDWAPAEATHAEPWIYHARRREPEGMILPDLPAFLAGTYRPTDNVERLCLLGVCQSRDLHVSAGRLYADA